MRAEEPPTSWPYSKAVGHVVVRYIAELELADADVAGGVVVDAVAEEVHIDNVNSLAEHNADTGNEHRWY